MTKIFYCAKCKELDENYQFDEIKDRDKKTYVNIRDGYGSCIIHVICHKCSYQLAGFIRMKTKDKYEIEYIRETIRLYAEPNINGCWDDEDRKRILDIINKNKRRDFNGK